VRPILADVPASDTEEKATPGDIEGAVPWAVLQQVLGSHVTLKPHQRLGIAWLWHRYVSGESGAVLADDMGLGKTLQIACFLALVKLTRKSDRARRPSLIIAPVMLIENWYGELTAFFEGPFPGRLVQLKDERLRGMRLPNGELDRVQLETFDVVIASYETLARYAMALLGVDWDVVVLDEAHRIKNRGTQWSVAARGLSGRADQQRPRKFEFGICATGTPVENSVGDLWALYDFASPGSPFGAYESFRQHYERADDAPRQLGQRLQIGSLASSLLRRDKAEVLTGFPPKTYHTIPIPMTPAQRDLERTLTRSSVVKAGGSFKILESLQKLYQHPWLLKSETELDPASGDDAIKASPKLAECIKLLERIQSLEEKALVFTLWTRMQWLLKEVIEQQLGLSDIPILNGDPKNRKRAHEHIEKFSKTHGFAVMILSPLAAGVGLNITAANHVIHYGRWWNPAKEDQATDRVYRIGQSRPVQVYYPVLHHPDDPTEGFDVKLDELVSRKRATARQLLEPAAEDDLRAEDLRKVGLEVG
jgi:SNF2 family DNA or RNA helicase